MTEQEKYKGAAIVAKLPLQLLPGWWFLGGHAVTSSTIGEDLPNFPHMTIYYLGNINGTDLIRAKAALKSSIGLFDKILGKNKVRLEKVEIIGNREVGNYLVISAQISDNLKIIRQKIENKLPEFSDINLPFKPHFTLGQIKSDKQMQMAQALVTRLEPEPPWHIFIRLEKLGIYCDDRNGKITELYSQNT